MGKPNTVTPRRACRLRAVGAFYRYKIPPSDMDGGMKLTADQQPQPQLLWLLLQPQPQPLPQNRNRMMTQMMIQQLFP